MGGLICSTGVKAMVKCARHTEIPLMANRAHLRDNSSTRGVCVFHTWIVLRLDIVYMLGFN